MVNLGFFLAQMEASILLGWGSAQKILRTAGGDCLMKTDSVAPKKNNTLLVLVGGKKGIALCNLRLLNTKLFDEDLQNSLKVHNEYSFLEPIKLAFAVLCESLRGKTLMLIFG
jgi:hypothetical protein